MGSFAMPVAATIESGSSITNASPGHKVVPVTLGTVLADGPCRSFACGTPGTLNFIDGSGATRTNYPAQQGYNPVEVRQFLTGGAGSDFWAIY